MTFRNLLLHLDGTRACAAREDAAVALASEHDAHLTGLYCIGELHIEGWAEWPVDMVEKHRDQAQQLADQVVARFADKAGRADVRYETRVIDVRANVMAERVARQGRYADVVILGQNDPDQSPVGGSLFVEHVMLSSGRPILVIPYIGAPGQGRREGPHFGRKAMIAWDGGREAARAVNDAMPLLERAGHVDVVVVNPRTGERGHGDAPGADIALHLSRHGLEVNAQAIEARDMGTADTLLSRLSDRGSDLLVMGGYGHSRLREIVLGGVTRRVLEQATVPVLMSH